MKCPNKKRTSNAAEEGEEQKSCVREYFRARTLWPTTEASGCNCSIRVQTIRQKGEKIMLKQYWWLVEAILWTVVGVTLLLIFAAVYKKGVPGHVEMCSVEGVDGHGDWYE
jgi:hypothetical protein